MNPLDYLHLQLRLEGKEIINGDLLRQVEIVPDEEMPLMIIARLSDEDVVAYYDEALQPALYKELGKRIQDVAFPEISPLLAFLGTQNISVDVGHYKTPFYSHKIDNIASANLAQRLGLEFVLEEIVLDFLHM
jgi:hypothetical protein